MIPWKCQHLTSNLLHLTYAPSYAQYLLCNKTVKYPYFHRGFPYANHQSFIMSVIIVPTITTCIRLRTAFACSLLYLGASALYPRSQIETDTHLFKHVMCCLGPLRFWTKCLLRYLPNYFVQVLQALQHRNLKSFRCSSSHALLGNLLNSETKGKVNVFLVTTNATWLLLHIQTSHWQRRPPFPILQPTEIRTKRQIDRDMSESRTPRFSPLKQALFMSNALLCSVFYSMTR